MDFSSSDSFGFLYMCKILFIYISMNIYKDSYLSNDWFSWGNALLFPVEREKKRNQIL